MKPMHSCSMDSQVKGKRFLKIALAGQPNCGKSTLFNQVAGYKAITSNFPGKTVKYTLSKVNFLGETFEIIDLPGTYSLTSFDLAELESRKYLLSGEADVVINVVDASILSRSLELTLQLLELEVPIVICLNFMDEAKRKGIKLNGSKLSEILGVPVVECVAVKGIGINKLFLTALIAAREKKPGRKIRYSEDIEKVIYKLSKRINTVSKELNTPSRLLAIKLLENDDYFISKIKDKSILDFIENCQRELSEVHGRPSDLVISSERHALSMNIFEQVAFVGEPQTSIRDKLDDLLMHKYLGYVTLAVFLYAFFNLIFSLGRFLEEPILSFFEETLMPIAIKHVPSGLAQKVIQGLLEGVSGGIGIVLPYLVPFLLGLAFMEDLGYLPRIAFLMDTFLHKIGLHGKSTLPLILGYGCNVPAVMATRILESDRDRFITAVISTMIPCAARTTIIFGLVAFFISPNAALFIYLLNLAVVAIAGLILSRLLPEATPGMIMEIPPYQVPSLKVVLSKTWLRLREFIFLAWPLLIAGSMALSLIEFSGLDASINLILSPITLMLGLPIEVGTTLIFGVLRKELTMLMLIQVLGTSQILNVLSKTQIMTFTVFVVFYIPCLATFAMLTKEIGYKRSLAAASFTFIIAFFTALIVKLFLGLTPLSLLL